MKRQVCVEPLSTYNEVRKVPVSPVAAERDPLCIKRFRLMIRRR
jgi:hypothetical protein